MCDTFYKREAIINKEGYNEYIRKYAPKQLDKFIDTLDDEDIIEAFTIGFPNSSHSVYYDVLWIIPTSDDNIPVLIQHINTSSCYSLWSCGIDEEDIEEIKFDEVIRMVGKGWVKGLRKVITEEYINKKKEDSVEEILNSLIN